jgi:hypothetical protein
MEIGCSMLAGGSIIALGCTSALARELSHTTISGKQLPAPDPKLGRVIQGEGLGLESLAGFARAARILADLI